VKKIHRTMQNKQYIEQHNNFGRVTVKQKVARNRWPRLLYVANESRLDCCWMCHWKRDVHVAVRAYCTSCIKMALNCYAFRYIGRNSTVLWPLRSPDLIPSGIALFAIQESACKASCRALLQLLRRQWTNSWNF